MAKSFLTISVVILLSFFISDYTSTYSENKKTSNSANNLFEQVILMHSSREDTLDIPEEITFPSNVGEVIFPHQFHIEDVEMDCVECHHQINAEVLSTPHPEYFKSSWINCEICHNESGQIEQKIYTCSECHHPSPENIADETLSSKVVIHKSCWVCHEVGTGTEASEICSNCHSGDKNKD
ncbi:MAG: hypothetical protein OEM46_11695 [Ignavibacteria bacterium]|nr:hypothetical protein [Ignavibacteria bacterium]